MIYFIYICGSRGFTSDDEELLHRPEAGGLLGDYLREFRHRLTPAAFCVRSCPVGVRRCPVGVLSGVPDTHIYQK